MSCRNRAALRRFRDIARGNRLDEQVAGHGLGLGIVRGVGVNPSTSLAAVEPLLDELDYLLILAINPGWSGQAFLPSTAGRLAQARRLIEASGRPILLGVDGGVTRDNIEHVATLGADIIVSGSAIFDGTPGAAGRAASMVERVRSRIEEPVP